MIWSGFLVDRYRVRGVRYEVRGLMPGKNEGTGLKAQGKKRHDAGYWMLDTGYRSLVTLAFLGARYWKKNVLTYHVVE